MPWCTTSQRRCGSVGHWRGAYRSGGWLRRRVATFGIPTVGGSACCRTGGRVRIVDKQNTRGQVALTQLLPAHREWGGSGAPRRAQVTRQSVGWEGFFWTTDHGATKPRPERMSAALENKSQSKMSRPAIQLVIVKLKDDPSVGYRRCLFGGEVGKSRATRSGPVDPVEAKVVCLWSRVAGGTDYTVRYRVLQEPGGASRGQYVGALCRSQSAY